MHLRFFRVRLLGKALGISKASAQGCSPPRWRSSATNLRHRRLSLWHHQGLPAAALADRAGHARASMSLDVYSHVLVDDADEWAVPVMPG
jgi:integrase